MRAAADPDAKAAQSEVQTFAKRTNRLSRMRLSRRRAVVLPGDECLVLPSRATRLYPHYPRFFPIPHVSRADLPAGVEGDVIVEVTIDAQGNVVETKLLQGIGYGIEQKVLAVLQRWHFRPAMRDGVTIASQHIVHFHYPA